MKSYGHFFDFALIAFFSATSQRNVKEYSVSFYLGVCDFFFISLEIGIDTGSAKRKEKKGKKKKAIFYHNSTKLNADTSCFYSSFIF